jgi:hypothetical protein
MVEYSEEAFNPESLFNSSEIVMEKPNHPFSSAWPAGRDIATFLAERHEIHGFYLDNSRPSLRSVED